VLAQIDNRLGRALTGLQMRQFVETLPGVAWATVIEGPGAFVVKVRFRPSWWMRLLRRRAVMVEKVRTELDLVRPVHLQITVEDA
jgi:hypothetical protein